MQIRLLIDGYNVIAPVAPPGRPTMPKNPQRRPPGLHAGGHHSGTPDRWLEEQRRRLLNRLADALDDETRRRTVVVFDANHPPPNAPDQLTHRDIQVRFAVDHDEADDLIEEFIAAHHSPKSLTVVSSDHRLQAAAKRRKAASYDSEAWLDALEDGHAKLAAKKTVPVRDAEPEPDKPDADTMDAEDVAAWLRRFDQSP